MKKTLLYAAILVLGLAAAAAPAPSLVGVWKVTEIVHPQGERNLSPQPTVYTFTARHYSHVSVTSKRPRPNHTGPSATDSERVEMWGPFSATAGTYELGEGEFTVRPIVAKNPGFMVAGSFMTFELTPEGEDIWIRAKRSNTGPIPREHAYRVRLIRLE